MAKQILGFAVGAVAFLALVYIAHEVWAESRRPMFFEDRARFGPFWLPPEPWVDAEGATIWADRRLNLLVVVETDEPDDPAIIRTAGPDRVGWGNGRGLSRMRDAVVFITEDGEREQYELEPDQAGRLKEQVREASSFFDAIRATLFSSRR